MTQGMRRTIFRSLFAAVVLALVSLGACRYYGCMGEDAIQQYQPAQDRYAVEQIFEQNWYWLINVPYKEALASFTEDLDKVTSLYERQKPDVRQWIVFKEDGTVKGFAVYYIKKPGIGKILFLAVDERYRGHGLAQRLIQRAMEALEKAGCKTIEIVVRVENFRAQNLYRKVGFETVKTDETFMYMERYRG
jgi:ribosomal protein S18 acetylase RimI-like enzyme